MRDSTEPKISNMDLMTGRVFSVETDDVFLSAHDSDIEKTKDVISEYDDELRKRSRSRFERIRLEGLTGVSEESVGGFGSAGVSGTGRGFSGGGCGFRRVRAGNLSFAAEPGAIFRFPGFGWLLVPVDMFGLHRCNRKLKTFHR